MKNVVITGAANGVGKAIANVLKECGFQEICQK